MATAAKRKTVSLRDRRTSFAAYVDAQAAAMHSNDVGGLLGQLALLRETRPSTPAMQRQWNEAVSIAVSGQRRARSR